MKSAQVDQSKKPRKRRLGLGCILAGCGVLVLVIFGIVLGWMMSPIMKTWLVDHSFIDSISSDLVEPVENGVREVVVEENMVIDVVEKVKNGVVSIAVAEVSLDSETGVIEDSVNIGTGFMIEDSGLVLTNQHVVSRIGEDYIIVTSSGEEYEVDDISRDDVNDLAILKVDLNGDEFDALTLGNSDELSVGQFVVAIGTPLGDFPGSVTSGIISGLGRSVTATSGGFWGTSRTYEDVIQTDAAINPGNSGGPLLDIDGNVIGISFATTSGADNISFALPINRAKERIAEYNEYGRFIKPYLGVEYQLISPTQAMMFTNVVPGALVKRVVDDSPADSAGIKRMDIITKVAGEEVLNSFSLLIQEHAVGDEIKLEIWRDGEYIEMTAVLEEMD
ncbi:MAG: trypsin-like peptidase domain-containing protein [Patescibacteria group bacterium]|nr:trypsin-like peptidase domain-containing protein [Patescibacteria group bacterium]